MKISEFFKHIGRLLVLTFLVNQSCYSQEYLRNVVQINANFAHVNIEDYADYTISDEGMLSGFDLSYRFRFSPRQSVGLTFGYNREIFSDDVEKMNVKHFLLSYKLTTKATRRFQAYLSPQIGLIRSKYYYEQYYYDINSNYVSTKREEKFGSFTYGLAIGIDVHIHEHFIFNLSANGLNAKNQSLYLGAKLGLAYKF